MNINLNAYEVLAIAEEVKRNGVNFYRHISKYCRDAETRKVLLDLSEMEYRDAEWFLQMRLGLSDDEKATTRFDPQTDAWIYMRDIIDTNVYDVRHDPCERLSGRSDVKDVLRAAIELEKDAIVFFLNLKRHILSRDRSDKIDIIIRGQMRHIVILSNELGLLESSALLMR